jgi:pectate lyase
MEFPTKSQVIRLAAGVVLVFGLLRWPLADDANGQPPTWAADQTYKEGSIVRHESRAWLALADAPRGHAPLGTGDGSQADRDLLLTCRAGFGRNATGGYQGPTHHVTTAADSGPGSLRDALSRQGPLWIVFDGDYTIVLRSGLPATSDKTIDGRGRRVMITGHKLPGLLIDGQSNIIVESLRLRDFGDVTRTKFNDTPDAILMENRAHDIWIDHCSLSMAGDKLIALHGGATDVTVSWNHLYEQQQVFQVGTQTTQEQDVNLRVTSHHNFFDRTGYRNPVVSYGRVHAYNNYLRQWVNYGMRAQRTGQLYSEANVFEAGDNKAAVRFDTPGSGWNDPHTRYDKRPGCVRSEGDLKLNGAKIRTREPEKVFLPRDCYAYQADRADENLKTLVAGYSGPQPGAWKPIGGK